MGKIVAVGGGEIGRQGHPVETTSIDEEIIRLSGVKNPRLLFIPTASNDSESYVEAVKTHFGKDLGCAIQTLYLINRKSDSSEIGEMIFNSDIIYVGGGNTQKMLRVWRRSGVDEMLLEAYRRGIVLSGLSAGAICWFRYGSSDSRKFSNPDAGLIKIKGLNIIDALYCPHYDVEEDRKPHLKELMRKTPGIALAFENCCAIEIVDDSYKIINSQSGAKAFKVYWRKGIFHEEIIRQEEQFLPITALLRK
jgi:dipeptidase E